MAAELSPPLVRIDIWGIHLRALAAMKAFTGTRSGALLNSGALFSRMVGTGPGVPLSVRDADLNHWALVTTWQDLATAQNFTQHEAVQRWRDIQTEHFTIYLTPVTAHGLWGGQPVFGECAGTFSDREPVATLTRGRVKVSAWRAFQSAVVPLADELAAAPGLAMRVGLTEFPYLSQGTFSVWSSVQALTDFAYRYRAHQEVMRSAVAQEWYSESLFARFRIMDYGGSFGGISWSS